MLDKAEYLVSIVGISVTIEPADESLRGFVAPMFEL